jgi:hypothetical protein
VTAGLIVSVVVTEAVPNFAVIVEDVVVVTVVVVAVKFTVAEPAGTVTLAGTTALVLLEVRPMTVPLGPAGPVRVTVPVDGFPPKMEGGVIKTLKSAAGVIVSVALAVCPPEKAVITALVLTDTPFVVMGNTAVSAPLGTTTKAGTCADSLLLLSATTAPPTGAACDSVTVPVLVSPPRTEVGLRVKLRTEVVLTCVPTAYKKESFDPT